MAIRDLDANKAINELVRHGYRHAGDYGIMMNAHMHENDFFRLDQPYRAVDGRIVVIHKGQMDMEIDLMTYCLKAGDVAVMLPDALILANCISTDCEASAVIFRQFPDVHVTAESFVIGGEKSCYLRVCQYMNMIFDQFNRSPLSADVVLHLINALIFDLYGQHAQSEQLATKCDDFMHRFIRLLNKEGRSKHSIQFYADRMCVSPNYMSTVVKRESHLTVLQWIYRVLIREAKVRLCYGEAPISEIAESLGFATPSSFIRFFREQTGQTPLHYRKQ